MVANHLLLVTNVNCHVHHNHQQPCFQLTEEDIRHLMEEVADANGELSKNDFILHVKVL